MSSGFCEVGAELTDKGTLCFLQFFECSRGLDSEQCKHVVSYWSLREEGRRGRTEEEERRGERKGEKGGGGVLLKLKQECKIQATNTKMR